MKFKPRFIGYILIVALALVTLRLMLPVIMLAGVNYVLRHKIEDYTGHVDKLDLAILKGSAVFKDLHIEKKDQPNALAVDVENIQLNWAWQDLWDKKVKVDLMVADAVVVMDEIPKKKPPQPDDLTFAEIRKKLGESNWASELNKLELRNCSVKFIVPKAKAPLLLSNIDADIFNMHFSPIEDWQLSNFFLRGKLQGQGEVKLSGQIQPLALPPIADVNFSLEDFDVKTLNGLLLKVVPMDLTRGKLSAYIEMVREKDFSNGYAKVFFDEVDVVANKQKFKSGRHVILEFGTALSQLILKNSKEKSLAVKVPFKIMNGDMDIKTSQALLSTLKNRRHELDRKIENSVSFSQNRSESLMR